MNRFRLTPTAPRLLAIVAAWLGNILGCLDRSFRRRRVPVLLQLNAVECGAACLAMVLGYHGRKTRVAELRDNTGVGRNGLTARTISQAARAYGLIVRAFSLEAADFRLVPLPAIVHWDFEHFVVVERWSPKAVTIIDPAAGRRRLTGEEFAAHFTGVVLACQPGPEFDRSGPARRPQWRSYVRRFLRLAPGALAQIVFASLVLQALGLAVPVLTKVVVDRVLPGHVTDLLPILGLGLLVVVTAQLVSTYLRAALLLALQARVDRELMLGFFGHLLSLPFRFFEQRTTGDLMMRLGSNAIVRDTLTSQTLSIVLDGSLVIGYLGILLTREPMFGGVVLTVAALQVALLIGTRHRMHELTQRDLVAQADSQGYLVEALSGVATLKASGAEERALVHWSGLFTHQLGVSLRRGHLAAVIETALAACRTFAPLGLLWLGAQEVLAGTMSLGTMLALQALAAAVLMPLSSLVANGQRLQLVGAHLDRLTDVLEAEPEQAAAAELSVVRPTGTIELDHVGFRYDPQAPWALRDVSVTIEPGQKVALVGRTGSGKSTLAKLLLGLYAPTEGDVRFDGTPLGALDVRELRRRFGTVLQEPFLFSGSIGQNIAFNDPTMPLERIVEAARLAGIDDEIARLPMGYETWVAEGGRGLSGGQRQRLALARALATRPALLLLDEATSHLDAVTEAQVEQNLKDLACTRIVIAHRLSTIRNADLILVLDEGRVVEHGTHDELVARGGHYAALVRGQAPGATAVEPWAKLSVA
jgi:ABC-type bacteriocin/lantibiotic exporter with double-glycine peptidase domain